MRPFRFAVSTRGHDIFATARRAEELGYTTLCMPDHFSDQAAPLVSLAAAAAVTKKIRLGPLVCCNDFRHPAVLAKEAATLDRLSHGRLQLGLGAGWMLSDYEQSGIPMETAGLRIERLAESLAIVQALLGGGSVSHEGKHYRIRNLEGQPTPLQDPVPLYLGGGGQRMLTLAAQRAQIVGIGLNLKRNEMCHIDFSAESCDRKLDWVRQAAGTRFEQLDLSLLLFEVCLTDEPERIYAELAERMETSVDIVRESPVVLVGSLEGIKAQLQQRRRRWGINEWIVRDTHYETFSPITNELTGK